MNELAVILLTIKLCSPAGDNCTVEYMKEYTTIEECTVELLSYVKESLESKEAANYRFSCTKKNITET